MRKRLRPPSIRRVDKKWDQQGTLPVYRRARRSDDPFKGFGGCCPPIKKYGHRSTRFSYPGSIVFPWSWTTLSMQVFPYTPLSPLLSHSSSPSPHDSHLYPLFSRLFPVPSSLFSSLSLFPSPSFPLPLSPSFPLSLRRIGVDTANFIQDDGSGISRLNMVKSYACII